MLYYLLLALVCLAGLIIFVFLSFVSLVIAVIWYGNSRIYDIPVLTWLTLDELKAQGFWRFGCANMMTDLYRNGELEIRLREEVENWKNRWHERNPGQFNIITIDDFEFRVTHRRPPKR